eukprot:2279105-Amphidinium_carterae.1
MSHDQGENHLGDRVPHPHALCLGANGRTPVELSVVWHKMIVAFGEVLGFPLEQDNGVEKKNTR